ncbi:MAG: amidohydrolase family protein [Streptosporangiaceae bacterium]
MRRTLRAGWVITSSAERHHLLRRGCVTIDGDVINQVGPELPADPGEVIELPNCLVTPGLISTHTHSAVNAAEAYFLDPGRPDAFGRNYLNWLAGRTDSSRAAPDTALGIEFTLAQSLASGVTTTVDFGSAGNPAVYVEVTERVGARVYTGPSHRNALISSDERGRFVYDWQDERGWEGLRSALAVAERYDGAAGGRVHITLNPSQPDTCSLPLLRETAREARDRGLLVTTHLSIHALELERTMQMHRMTPAQVLDEAGLLNRQTLLAHSMFLSDHSWSGYRATSDLELLGRRGASVSHSPLKYFHLGVQLESFSRYRDAGVNMTIGTDFAPRDILAEMRAAMLLSRVADRTFLRPSPAEVFDAATIGAADALNRPDLGRVMPAAKADLVVFDLRSLAFGGVHDPIEAVVLDGSPACVHSVYVDGRPLIENRQFRTVAVDDLLQRSQAECERLWADTPNWSWGGRGLGDIAPMTYDVLGES